MIQVSSNFDRNERYRSLTVASSMPVLSSLPRRRALFEWKKLLERRSERKIFFNRNTFYFLFVIRRLPRYTLCFDTERNDESCEKRVAKSHDGDSFRAALNDRSISFRV